MKTLLAMLLVCASAAAAAPAASVQVPIQFSKLKNGLRLVISEDHSAPVVTVAVYYKIGFRLEPRGRTGFAHLFEHMMFQGSENAPKPMHITLVNANGGVLNGSTRLDYTNYFETLPSNALEPALWLEADRMRSLNITPENLKNQQDVVKEEVRVNVLNQPYGAFDWLELPQKAFKKWENAHNFYGDFTDLEAASMKDVSEFFRTFYTPANAVLVISGDVEPKQAAALAEKYFGGIPSRPQPPVPDVSEPPQKQAQHFTQDDKLAATPALAVGYRLPPSDHRNELTAVWLLEGLLAEGEGSRLYQRLVKDQKVATSVGTVSLGSYYEYLGPSLFTIRVDYRNDATADQILKTIDAELLDIAKAGVPAKEMERGRKKLRAAWLEALDTTSVFGTAALGRPHYLAVFALLFDDPGVINQILPEIDALKAEQVQAVARNYFQPSQRTSIDRRPAAKAAGGTE